MVKEKKPRKKSQNQLLVEALLGLDSDPSKHPNINWPIEMKMLKALLKKEGDVDFWFFVAKRRRVNSLMNLLGDDGFIFRCKLEYSKQKFLQLPSPISSKLEDNKIGEDFTYTQKKTLLDFINS